MLTSKDSKKKLSIWEYDGKKKGNLVLFGYEFHNKDNPIVKEWGMGNLERKHKRRL